MVLVALPETTPVNEVIETAYALEDLVGVQLGPLVVNGVDTAVPLPDPEEESAVLADVADDDALTLAAAAAFRRSRREMERQELERLATELPLPQIRLTARPVAGLTADDIGAMASELTGEAS